MATGPKRPEGTVHALKGKESENGRSGESIWHERVYVMEKTISALVP